MKTHQFVRYLVKYLIVFSLLLVSPIQAKKLQDRTWEERFTMRGVENGESSFMANPYTWAYTPSFAKEYGMPEKWVNEGLKGIEAIAYRTASSPIGRCGIQNDPASCNFYRSCTFDLFINKSIDVPWSNNNSQGFRTYGRGGPLAFLKNTPKNKDVSDARFYFAHFLEGEWKSSGSITTLQFDKESLEDLTLITISATCSIPKMSGNIEFYILNPEQKHLNSYKDIKNPLHTIKIPSTYMKRVNDRVHEEIPGYITERKKLKLKTKS